MQNIFMDVQGNVEWWKTLISILNHMTQTDPLTSKYVKSWMHQVHTASTISYPESILHKFVILGSNMIFKAHTCHGLLIDPTMWKTYAPHPIETSHIAYVIGEVQLMQKPHPLAYLHQDKQEKAALHSIFQYLYNIQYTTNIIR